MSKLSRVYAGALFDIALEASIAQEILQQTVELLAVLKENPKFEKLLNAPVVPIKEKIALLDEIFGGKINTYLLNYMKVMTQRKCAFELADSFLEYEKLYNKHNNIEKVTAITAVPMTGELMDKLKAKLTNITEKTILLNNVVDKNCIGGVILKMNDHEINDSIAQKLETLKAQLRNINA
ncbi:MAG: ATP synthase F1 subunit delta [Oscillospiraceae bacterium]